jgi:hypothetical protein
MHGFVNKNYSLAIREQNILWRSQSYEIRGRESLKVKVSEENIWSYIVDMSSSFHPLLYSQKELFSSW